MFTYPIPDEINIDDLCDALEQRGYTEHVHFEVEFDEPDNTPTLHFFSEDFREVIKETLSDFASEKNDSTE